MSDYINIIDGQAPGFLTDAYSVRAYIDRAGWSVDERGDEVRVIMPEGDGDAGIAEVYGDFCAALPNLGEADDDFSSFEARDDIAPGCWTMGRDEWSAAAMPRSADYDIIVLTGSPDDASAGVMAWVEGGWSVAWDDGSRSDEYEYPDGRTRIIGVNSTLGAEDRWAALEQAAKSDPRYQVAAEEEEG